MSDLFLSPFADMIGFVMGFCCLAGVTFSYCFLNSISVRKVSPLSSAASVLPGRLLRADPFLWSPVTLLCRYYFDCTNSATSSSVYISSRRFFLVSFAIIASYMSRARIFPSSFSFLSISSLYLFKSSDSTSSNAYSIYYAIGLYSIAAWGSRNFYQN